MSSLYLIRHGRTPANDAHLYCGSTDIGLSESGIQALNALSYDIHPDLFLTSGMKRTEQTLRLLFGPVDHEIRPEFREIDFGAFEMKSYEQLKEDPDYQAWITGDNESNIPPEGESGVMMKDRVLKALTPLLNGTQSVAVITHGGVIAAVMETLFPEEGKSRYEWQPKPGYGYGITGGRYFPIP